METLKEAAELGMFLFSSNEEPEGPHYGLVFLGLAKTGYSAEDQRPKSGPGFSKDKLCQSHLLYLLCP